MARNPAAQVAALSTATAADPLHRACRRACAAATFSTDTALAAGVSQRGAAKSG